MLYLFCSWILGRIVFAYLAGCLLAQIAQVLGRAFLTMFGSFRGDFNVIELAGFCSGKLWNLRAD